MADDPSREQGMVPAGESLPDRLPPVPQGWPIRRCHGHRSWQLAPPRAQPVVRVLAWTPFALTVGAIVALQVGGHGSAFWIWWMIGKGGVVKVGSVTAAGVA